MKNETAVKVIKRYQNRKLYDTTQSCYVTLDEISDMIVRGEDIEVIDNRTKKNITSNTLMQILFEKQKKSRNLLPIATLREIIVIGEGSLTSFLRKVFEDGSFIPKVASTLKIVDFDANTLDTGLENKEGNAEAREVTV